MQRSTFTALVLLVIAPVYVQSQGRFSGLSYFDYYYNISRPTNLSSMQNVTASGVQDMQAFQIRRLFFTYDDDLSKEFTTRFRLDVDQSATTTDGRISVFLKDASLTWKNIFHGSNLCVGLQPTLSFEVIEGVWGYRSAEKTILDLRNLIVTRDMGLSLKGDIDDGGIVQYGLLVGNNASSRPASSKFKRYYGQLVVRPEHKFVLAAYADYSDRASVVDPYNVGTRVVNGILTADGMAGFIESGRFSVGIEASSVTAFNGYDNGASLTNVQSLGASVFGSLNFYPALSLLARFGYFDPDVNASVRGDSRNYALLGVSWKPNPKVSIIPNILYETYEALLNGTTITASMTARVTVYYEFL